MAEAFELLVEANREEVEKNEACEVLAEMLGLVGLGTLTQPDKGAEADADAEKLLGERQQARAEKDFGRADEIRDRLAELGWEVRDGAEGAKLVPKA